MHVGIKSAVILPSNWAIKDCADDPRLIPYLEEIVPIEQKKSYDMRKVIKALADEQELLEVKPEFAGEIITGFARISGHTVGIVANQPMVMAGCMTVNSSDKQARFIRFCDAFKCLSYCW
jgi:propionyl-CoA carboxylase beta chain